MRAVTDRCARCYQTLTADHVLRAGVRHCYGCELQLLKDQDASAALARPIRLRRRPRSVHPLAARGRLAHPVIGVAARRPGARPERLTVLAGALGAGLVRPAAAPVGRRA